MHAWMVIQPVEFAAVLVVAVWLTRNLTAELVANLNAISAQVLAFAVILMGWGMLVACKRYGIDTTIAGGVIGVGSNMLQNKRPVEDTPNAATTVNETTTIPKP